MLKPESLSTKAQREDGSTFSSILSSKPETDFLENIHPLIIMSVQRRAEKSQSRAARPLPRLPACENAFALDLFTLTSGSNQEVGDWQKSQAGRPRGGRPAPNCLTGYNRCHLLNRPQSTINRAHSPTCNTHHHLRKEFTLEVLFVLE